MHFVLTVGEPFMAPVTQYVFAETRRKSERFTAGRHECLPYSVISTFPKLICKQQFIFLPIHDFPLAGYTTPEKAVGIWSDSPQRQ